jgi:ComF family protein
MIKFIFDLTKEILFPKFCYGCGKYNIYLCPNCLKKIILENHNNCPYCKKPNYLGLTCGKCKREYRVSGVMGIFRYDKLGKILIKKIKYKLVSEIFIDLFKNLPESTIDDLKKIKQIVPDATIIPVPLHKNRFNKRGFNQAEILGKYLSKILDVPMNNKLISRIIDTHPQAQIVDKKIRLLNMKNAFLINEDYKYKNKNFIIVDDVWTTGATIKEIVKLLKKFKAGKIYSIVLAR